MLKILNGESKSITSAALIVGAASLFSRVVGLLRDRILAGEFGAGSTLDIYYASFRIPDFLFNLLILGALSAGFIPIFAKLLHDDTHAGWKFAGTIAHMTVVVVSVLAVILFFLAPWFVPIMTPGFSDVSQASTVMLTRIMLFSPILLGVSAVFGGILQATRRFFVNAVAPVFYNIGIIFGVLLLVPSFGLIGLAWGVVLGALLHAAIQLPSVLHLGFRYVWRFSLTDPSVRRVGSLMLPRVVALGLTQVTLVAMTVIASTLAAGSLAVFNFANNLQSFAVGIIGVAYAIAAFPTLTAAVVRGDRDGFTRSFTGTARQISFFLIPVTVLFIVLRAQIVRAALGAGAFDWHDTVETFETLHMFAYGLLAQSLFYLIVRGFWAHEDTKTPALVAVAGAFVAIGTSMTLTSILGVQGLALGFTIGSIVQCVLSWILLRRVVGNLREGVLAWSLTKMIVAAFVMGWVVQWMKTWLGVALGTETLVTILIQGGVSALVGLFVYGCVCFLLRSPELINFLAGLRRRFITNPSQLELFEQ